MCCAVRERDTQREARLITLLSAVSCLSEGAAAITANTDAPMHAKTYMHVDLEAIDLNPEQ